MDIEGQEPPDASAAAPSSPGAVLVVDIDVRGRLKGSCAGDARLLRDIGCDTPLRRGQALDQYLRPEFREVVREALRACQASGGTVARTLCGNTGPFLDLQIAPRRSGQDERPSSFCLILREAGAEDRNRRMLHKLVEVARRTSNLVVITDAEQRIEWTNDAFTKASGYSAEEAIGRRPGKLLQFDGTDPTTVAGIRQALEARRPVSAEILNRGKSGREYWLALDIQPVTTAEGRLDGFVSVQTDVTQVRNRVQELDRLARDAEAMKALLMEAVRVLPDGFALFGSDGRLVLSNERFADLHPLAGQIVVPGVTLETILTAETANGEYTSARAADPGWLDGRLALLHSNEGWTGELELADGRWVRSVKIPTAGRGCIALRSEITALKRAESGAVAHRQMAMDASQDAIALTDPEGRVSYVNGAFARMFAGDDPDAWLGREWWQLCAPSERGPVWQAAMHAIDGEGRWRGYIQAVCTGGTLSQQEVSVTRATDGALFLISRDVGELKKDLQRETALHNQLMSIASRYLNTPFEQVDSAIEEALGQLATFVDADRAYLFSYDWDGGTTSNTHEWCAAGMLPQRDQLQSVPLAKLHQWCDAHRAGQNVIVHDVGELAPDSGLRELLEQQGIKSLAAIPVMDGTRCEGFVGFDSVNRRHHYSDRECLLLRFFSEISRSLRTRARLELMTRDFKEKLNREEERRRLQEALSLERVEVEAKLSGALVEMRRLYDRDRQMREESEMLVGALRSLSEATDLADGPFHLLQQLADGLETDCVALLPLGAGRGEPLSLGHDAFWIAANEDTALLDYLAQRPSRLISDLSATAIADRFLHACPGERPQWMAAARVGPPERLHVLLATGNGARALDQRRSQRFLRFVPLMAEALRRRDDSIRSRKLERDLQQAQKLEALGALAGSVAHEINTPMQYISDNMYFLRDSFADLIAAVGGRGSDRPDGDRAGGDLEYLLTEVPLALEQSLKGIRRVAEIVEAVRTAAYPELAPDERIDVRSTLEHCLTITRGQWKHDIDVSLHCEEPVPDLRGSPGQISQVFVNLTTNACDAVRSAGKGRRGIVRITVTSDETCVMVHFEDNGPGIPPEMRKRVFDRFFTTKGVGQGTGRGLEICNSIVEQHGGSIAIDDSTLGGARFTIRLPVGI
ncbi:MAG: PAS domain-containing protein [Rhodospirillales bacterium]